MLNSSHFLLKSSVHQRIIFLLLVVIKSFCNVDNEISLFAMIFILLVSDYNGPLPGYIMYAVPVVSVSDCRDLY